MLTVVRLTGHKYCFMALFLVHWNVIYDVLDSAKPYFRPEVVEFSSNMFGRDTLGYKQTAISFKLQVVSRFFSPLVDPPYLPHSLFLILILVVYKWTLFYDVYTTTCDHVL